ncbi:MAG: rubredoxin [Clostridiaceae bacterium]|jgi:rubredoxin|nr:rubredoxin [Clostridiaceae bacterium]
MAKYVCSVCGFVYDEAKGIPEAGIAPGTTWEELPEDWVCPLCGAAKSEFEKQGESAASSKKEPISAVEASSDMKEMSPLEVSALCTNLARGCEKQYKPEEAALFNELAGYFSSVAAPAEDPNFDKLLDLIEKDLKEGLPNANAVAADAKDRGALRALVWSEKVTRILKSIITRYQKEGDAMLENTGVYVCTICGFIYIGNKLPEVCPVCKVPNWKLEKVEGRI